MSRTRWIVVGVVVAVVLVAAGVAGILVASSPGGSKGGGVALPRSMASTGDSITKAFDVGYAGVLRDNPAESWATGTDAAIDSQYQRLLQAEPAIAGHDFNDAVSGSKMEALDGQLRTAASQGVDYATVLMGANDLCTPTVGTMTATATFSAQFHQALSDFFAADPGAHVLVASIPNLFQLWATLRGNLVAELIWGGAHICQSMLASADTTAERQAVVSQEQADNDTLAAVCRQFAHCRFDGGAVYRTAFTAAEVSPVDYFHPSMTGQKDLAAITWAAGYWPATP